MKKGVICFGVFLALFTTVFVSLSVSSDASALKYNQVGIPLGRRNIGQILTDSSGNRYLLKETLVGSGSQAELSNVFRLGLSGSAYDSRYNSLKLSTNLSYLGLNYNSNSNECELDASNAVRPILSTSSSNYGGFLITFGNFSLVPSDVSTSNQKCSIQSEFGDKKPNFNSGTLNNVAGYLTCGFSNGASCPGIWDVRNYISSSVLPYSYTTDTVYLNKSIKSVDGETYFNNFSFKQLFDGELDYIPKFSSLDIPIGDYEFNTDSASLYYGRQIEYRGSFMFKGSFSWNPDISRGAFQVYLAGATKAGNFSYQTYDCSTNFIDVPGADYRELTYSCPFTLPADFIYINPHLEIYNSDSSNHPAYVWETDDEWYWNGAFIITDNDETPGRDLNPNATGGSSAPGAPIIPSDSAGTVDEFFNKLTELFRFSFANPFAPLLSMFTDGGSCASIPTLAGMLHSEETTVCPWFDSTTRNIVTPVLSIASMMLIFGFAVRWLGASSGNLFEDSAKIEPPGTSAMNGTVSRHGWRRRK